MLNGGSVLGRLVPNVLADRYGHFNVTTPVTFICGGLIFAIYGISKSVGAVVVFSLLYGFFSGACKYDPSSRTVNDR